MTPTQFAATVCDSDEAGVRRGCSEKGKLCNEDYLFGIAVIGSLLCLARKERHKSEDGEAHPSECKNCVQYEDYFPYPIRNLEERKVQRATADHDYAKRRDSPNDWKNG